MTRPSPADASECAEDGEAAVGIPADAAAGQIAALEAEIEAFTRDMAACEQETRRLMAAEDPAAGVFFAQEIHAARHEKMRLVTEIQLRRVKINRLRLGITESMPPNMAKGFPF